MLKDKLGREIKDLRISVTDRCNLRCSYCMPLDQYNWISRREILSFEEIFRLAKLLTKLGINKLRITGGEPLLRSDLEKLVGNLASLKEINDLCLTTNGLLLEQKVPLLAAAGLKRINVSLDTLKPERFKQLTRSGELQKILNGLTVARDHGLQPIKINSVVVRGFNEDEIPKLVEYSRTNGFSIRFIEYMDVGNVNNWKSEKLVPKSEILETIHKHFPLQHTKGSQSGAPAVEYQFKDGIGDMGVIASVTEPFCSGCTRVRLTADGKLVTCLFAAKGFDLKKLLRTGVNDEEILEAIQATWQDREDRYSDERFEALNSKKGYRAGKRKKLEMITLGG